MQQPPSGQDWSQQGQSDYGQSSQTLPENIQWGQMPYSPQQGQWQQPQPQQGQWQQPQPQQGQWQQDDSGNSHMGTHLQAQAGSRSRQRNLARGCGSPSVSWPLSSSLAVLASVMPFLRHLEASALRSTMPSRRPLMLRRRSMRHRHNCRPVYQHKPVYQRKLPLSQHPAAIGRPYRPLRAMVHRRPLFLMFRVTGRLFTRAMA